MTADDWRLLHETADASRRPCPHRLRIATGTTATDDAVPRTSESNPISTH
jgi:hypothetical protein